ncbi:hypothetical protein [Ferruginibacter profundus]
MKKVFLLFISIVCITTIKAQKLTGLWYSSDSSRVYEIKEADDNQFIAAIKSSERKTDSIGYIVLKNLCYNSRKKRYEGVIYAVNDGKPAFVRIKFDKHNSNKIVLKLNRMFVMDVAINWVRVNV